MTQYDYPPWAEAEINRVIRNALTVGETLKRVSLEDDLGGIDAQYVIQQTCPLAVRARFNRPAWAADIDVTFRTTEPRMIRNRTYAPIAFFAWFLDQRIVAAKIIDIYRMAETIAPSLEERLSVANDDGTAFLCVEIAELHKAKALLRLYDGNHWTTQVLGGELRLQRIIRTYRREQLV